MVAVGAGDALAEPVGSSPTARVKSVANPTQVLLVGDSVGETVAPGISRTGIRVVDGAFWGCRIVRGTIRYSTQVGGNCNWPTIWRRTVHELRPRVVVLVSGVWDLFDVRPPGSARWLIPGTRAWGSYYAATLERAAGVLGSTGAHVVIPTIPYFGGVGAGTGRYGASSYDPNRVRAANEVIRRVAAKKTSRFAAPDLNRYLSPTGGYQAGLGAVPVVRSDGVHFSTPGANVVGNWLAPRLVRWLGDSVRKNRKPGPIRALLVGDSLTVSYQDAAAKKLATRGYQVTRAGVAESSILDTGACDGTVARALLASVDPDVVVFENNGNYGLRPGINPCAPRVKPGSKAFYRQWTTAARRNQKILTSRKAKFLWVLNPSVSHEPQRSMIPKINAIYRRLAGKRIGLIDAWGAFGGSRYDPRLHADEQQLNAAGAERIADYILLAVR
jgi:lysophospholipase L1-like esterase